MSDTEQPNWYLREWMAELKKRQADLVNDRGWPKGRVSKFFHGRYSYRREVVNDVAEWLGIQPFELLMHPQEALALQKLRAAAFAIASEAEGIKQGPKPAASAKS